MRHFHLPHELSDPDEGVVVLKVDRDRGGGPCRCITVGPIGDDLALPLGRRNLCVNNHHIACEPQLQEWQALGCQFWVCLSDAQCLYRDCLCGSFIRRDISRLWGYLIIMSNYRIVQKQRQEMLSASVSNCC